jgi:hypothetical protein
MQEHHDSLAVPFPQICRPGFLQYSSLIEEERKELESYLVIEYLMELVKLEAHRQLRQQTS